MKSALHERESDRYSAVRDEDSEEKDITLGIGSLLAIFFGVVLVCGLLFGLGYSLGHRSEGHSGAISTASPAHETRSPASGQSTTPVEPTRAKPSAAGSASSTDPAFPPNYKQPDPDGVLSQDFVPGDRSLPAHGGSGSAGKIVVVKNGGAVSHRGNSAAKPSAGAKNRPAAAEGSHAQIMVQVAALTHNDEAQALASALRKHGFTAMIRHGQADSFYRVQLGPFADRQAAVATQGRLESEGYNAILK
jgi:DedD protein